eukprot:212493-Pleurochrysis_carterae.AAC.3
MGSFHRANLATRKELGHEKAVAFFKTSLPCGAAVQNVLQNFCPTHMIDVRDARPSSPRLRCHSSGQVGAMTSYSANLRREHSYSKPVFHVLHSCFASLAEKP